MGLEGFDQVFFNDVGIGETLIVVEVNQVGCSIVLVIWATLWAISGKVSYFSTLKTGI